MKKNKPLLVYKFKQAVEKFKITPIAWAEGRKFLRIAKEIPIIQRELEKVTPREYMVKNFIKEVNNLIK